MNDVDVLRAAAKLMDDKDGRQTRTSEAIRDRAAVLERASRERKALVEKCIKAGLAADADLAGGYGSSPSRYRIFVDAVLDVALADGPPP
ncbi:hypothetical protein [Gordonia malaquae]|uniref:hypothetical protein n=1 Tax=Gordonia malaquae TaxID=410332 RepID=UPI00301B1742